MKMKDTTITLFANKKSSESITVIMVVKIGCCVEIYIIIIRV